MRGKQRCEDRDQQQEDKDNEAEHCAAIYREIVPERAQGGEAVGVNGCNGCDLGGLDHHDTRMRGLMTA